MPALWDKADMIVSHKTLAGALAHWAVVQSPYTAPENLTAAIEQFMRNWSYKDYAHMSSDEMEAAVRQAIDLSPLVRAWNEPKLAGAAGTRGYAFISSFHSIKPDYDFIDLSALCRNICHEITLWAQVEAAQDGVRSA